MTTTPTTSSDSGSGAAPSTGGLNYDAVENYWLQAGGNAQAANMAAAVASASSGLDPSITRTNPDGTTSVGLWLIPQNGQPPGSTDPLANARAAISLSNNGTDWSQWCVTWSDNDCGQDGGTYLGSGANALAALSSMNGTYNVIGSSVSGTNQGASAATQSTAPSPTGSSSSGHTLLLIGLLVVIVLVVVYASRKAQSSTPLESLPG
jgi:hypothetical protein